MGLRTRLTDRFGLVHPVVLAPMAFAAGGRLAAAVSQAGRLGQRMVAEAAALLGSSSLVRQEGEAQ